MMLPCHLPSCSAHCGFQLESAQFQRTAMQVINCTGRNIQGGNGLQKIFWSFSLASEVGQKAKTSSSLFAKETFPLAVYFPSSPTRNVERYPGCIDILPTLKMSWEAHRRWCSSAVWWKGHHVPAVGFKFCQRHPSASLLCLVEKGCGVLDTSDMIHVCPVDLQNPI